MIGRIIHFKGKIWIIFPKLSLLPLLIWSTESFLRDINLMNLLISFTSKLNWALLFKKRICLYESSPLLERLCHPGKTAEKHEHVLMHPKICIWDMCKLLD